MPRSDLPWVCRAIGRVADRQPGQTAIECGRGHTSYGQLWQDACESARKLASVGVGPGACVVIAAERGAPFVTGALACWLVGAAYLPLAIDDARQRLQLISSSSGAQVALASASYAAMCRELGLSPVPLLYDGPAPQASARVTTMVPDGTAYVVFTSGSTGTPKGVMIGHASLRNLIRWHVRTYSVGIGDRALHTAGLGFDAAVWEVWPYLAAGATVVACPDGDRSVAHFVVERLIDHRCTLAFMSTPMAEEMLLIQPALPDLRYLLTGGDVLRMTAPAPGGYRLVNHYGPSEATVVTTSHALAEGVDFTRPPIGKPIDGAMVELLDGDLCAVADGGEGEIFIGGQVLSTGYMGDTELTARRFLSLPNRPGRWYRSGDMAVWQDGVLHFRRRGDHEQLKVRGVRIEASEIESAVMAHPQIRTAAVTMIGHGASGLLIALVVPRGLAPSANVLQTWLRERLQRGVVPNQFIFVDRMPLNSSGKLDRHRIARLATEATQDPDIWEVLRIRR